MSKVVKPLQCVAVAIGLLLAGASYAQGGDAVLGKAKFDHSCAPCHGKGPGDDGRDMLPGTYALQIKYDGELPAALEDRSDLTAAVISVYVRQGTWSMPPFRKTELTDTEITDIAAYLAVSSAGSR
jgi:mono/diheme cytochrome c family protein